MKQHINRSDILEEHFREILDKETHHDHAIYKEPDGTLCWVPNASVQRYLANIDLNDLCPLLESMGYGKNSEVYRKLYRDMGYSLFGYWEIFYWEVNHDEADEYVPNAAALGNDR